MSSDPMLAILNGMRLAQQPYTFPFHHTHGDHPVSSFSRSVTSTVRSAVSGESETVFESHVEEEDGSGLKRVVVERGLGRKAMKLTQVTDGSGGTTEERLFDDANWFNATVVTQCT